MAPSTGTTRRRAVLGVLVVGALARAATPAYATGPVPADPVTLVVGLHPWAAADRPADRLDDAAGIDVIATEPVTGTGAVTVDVPAAEARAAAAELRTDPAVRYVEVDRVAGIAAVTPDDPYRGWQWGLDRATVPDAWQHTTGSPAVTVAVVDTGVSPVPDLAGALLAGRDFVNGDADAADDHGHGTLTAGVLAARGDNGLATAGVCWSCRILPVKVLGSNGSGYHSQIAAGIIWAADNGADIINLSLGGYADSQVLRDAVAHAVAAGVLVVAAAGNDGVATRLYPAANPSVLGVGWSTQTDARHAQSNYGATWVDLAAPGCNPAQGLDGAVWTFCGTSSATPFAAGVAALALAADPTATATTLRGLLNATADPLAGGWVARGRVNAGAAVSAVPWSDTQAPTASFRSPAATTLLRGSIAVTVAAADNAGIGRVDLVVGDRVVGTDRSAPWANTWKSGSYTGRVTLKVRVRDWAGNATVVSRRVTVDNTAPSVRFDHAPKHGVKRIRGTVRVTARAADTYGVKRVDLLVNGKAVGTETRAPYTFSIRSWRYGPRLTVQLRAYDRAGNVRHTAARVWYR
jgi:subtilisin family serine protease